jgi:hypothetical protein
MTIIKDPVLEPFHISKDQHCYTVVETVTPDSKNLEKGSKGKIYEKPLGHYGQFSQALKRIAVAKTDLKEEYTSIMDYIKTYDQQVEIINELFDKVKL